MVLEQDLFSKLQCKKEMKLFHMKLNSDGQHFKTKSNKANSHLSAQIIEQTKIPRHMTLEIQVLDWGWYKNVDVKNRLIES